MPTERPSVAAVSEALDSLSQQVGTILVRTREGWVPIEPGPAGYVLTSLGPDQIPEWRPPPSP